MKTLRASALLWQIINCCAYIVLKEPRSRLLRLMRNSFPSQIYFVLPCIVWVAFFHIHQALAQLKLLPTVVYTILRFPLIQLLLLILFNNLPITNFLPGTYSLKMNKDIFLWSETGKQQGRITDYISKHLGGLLRTHLHGTRARYSVLQHNIS
jgi:hypothetical protein